MSVEDVDARPKAPPQPPPEPAEKSESKDAEGSSSSSGSKEPASSKSPAPTAPEFTRRWTADSFGVANADAPARRVALGTSARERAARVWAERSTDRFEAARPPPAQALKAAPEKKPDAAAPEKKPDAAKPDAAKPDAQKEDEKKAADEKKKADEAKAKEEAEKRRQEEMDRLLAKKEVREGMKRLGLTEEEIRQAGDAGLKLLEAAEHAGSGRWKDAARSLLAAGKAAPDLVAKAAAKLADSPQITDPSIKALLKNGDFIKSLATDESSAKALDHFLEGRWGEGLKALSTNKDALGHAVDTLYATNKDFKKALDALGVKPETLKKNLDAVPHLVDAALKMNKQPPDVLGAVKDLVEAGKKAPDVMSEVIANFAKGLKDTAPEKYIKAIFGDADAVKAMLTDQKAHAGVEKLLKGDLSGLRDLAGSDAAEKVVKALAREPGIAAQLKKLGLDGNDLAQLVKSSPHVFDALASLANGKFGDAFKSVMKAIAKAPDVAEKLIKQMASKIDPNGPLGPYAHAILNNEKAMKALLHDEAALDALGRLGSGDMSALRDLLKTKGSDAVLDALGESPKVKELLSKIGLEPKDLKSIAKVLPDVLDAAQKLGEGKWQEAFKSLKDALGQIDPKIAAKMIAGAVGNIKNLPGPIKALLTDPKLLDQLLTNPAAKGALDKLLSGNPMDAAKELLSNPAMRTAAAEALFRDPKTKALLQSWGIKDPKALADLGHAAGEVMDAVQKAAAGDYKGSLEALGKAWGSLSPQQKADLISGLADHLKLPPGLKHALQVGAEVLGTPGVADALGRAIQAAKDGKVGPLATALADAGKLIAQHKPELAVSFLNSLKHLPGSVGKLFADEKLNEAIVKSGAFPHLLDAMASLANKDLSGALKHMAQAGVKLATAGEHFKVPGVGELPVGKEGLENMGRLFGRLWDALPDGIKRKLEQKVAKLAASMGMKAIPGLGNVMALANLGMDGAALVKELVSGNKDPTTLFLLCAQVGVDVASLFPGLNSIAAPLGTALAMMQLLTGPGLIDSNFDQELLDLSEPQPQKKAA